MDEIRRSKMKALVLFGLGVLGLLSAPALAADADYPTKLVTINTGSSPGGAAWIGAQIMLEGLPRYYTKGHPFIQVSRPGATHMVATTYFMKQPADGYNLIWLAPESWVAMAKDPQKFSFTIKDFSFLGYFYHAPFVLVVNNASPFKTFEDFFDYAKKHPGVITCSSVGIGSGSDLLLQMIMKETGIKITLVPFPSTAAATLASLGGHVTCTLKTFGSVSSHLKSGLARALVVFDTKRDPKFPEVPTCKEKGIEIFRGSGHALTAKKGTPKPILDYLANLFKQIANDPIVQSNISRAGFNPMYMGPEETEKFVSHDFEMASDIFKKLGLVGK